MSDKIVIRAELVGKKYWIGHEKQEVRYRMLRDAVVHASHNVLRKVTELRQPKRSFIRKNIEEFWALKNVSFELRCGEVLGIIGRNGAGKSTLLKILSRITEPSTGRVTIEGRVSSLLEVGTGFHPELTGRENIFLNGAILGMSRSEIRKKFGEIVDFAEVERFLDTPVKHYSSGMYVRLAFAVAAHLEPEILVVDEVLAVGDGEFQKKCLNKMSEVASGGRTILFVSHNLAAISDLCTRAILLRQGEIQQEGDTDKVIAAYIEESSANQIGEWITHNCADIVLRVKLAANSTGNVHESGTPLELTVNCVSSRSIRLDEFCLIFENLRGHRVGIVDFRISGQRIVLPTTEVFYCARIDNVDLVQGTYSVKLWLSGTEIAADIELGSLEVIEASRGDRLSLFPPHMNGILNFRGNVRGPDGLP